MHSARVTQNVLLSSSRIANWVAGRCRHIIPEGSGILAHVHCARAWSNTGDGRRRP
eukprot:COSAG02_NODE_47935_length_337_cov_1.268908_1_plen_55_part_01